MKLQCPCGEFICDNTDEIPYKGHVFADQDFFTILESIELCISLSAAEPGAVEKAKSDANDALISKTRGIWRCESCGRVAIDDASCRVYWYRPEEGANVNNLLSAKEANFASDGT